MAILKTPREVAVMAEAGRKLAQILDVLKKEIKPGISTWGLEALSQKLIRESGARSAFLGYRPPGTDKAYPYSLCVSINAGVVHGQPSQYVIKPGDVVKLDLGLKFKGFYVDSAITVCAGECSSKAKSLIETTRAALLKGIAAARAGNMLGDIGYAIESYVVGNKFSVVESLTGHGIGRKLHEEPSVLNTGKPGRGIELQAGMVLAIEPMVAAGAGRIKQLKDDSFVTADGSIAAHFEHTVAITPDGPHILTEIGK